MVLPGADNVQFTGRLPPIYLEGRLPVLETPLVQSLGLRDGQVVRPVVESRDGQLMLLLQGQAIALPPQLRLAVGERPWWQVTVDARGRATLTPLAAPTASGADAARTGGAGGVGTAAGGGAAPAAGAASRLEQLALRPPVSLALETLLQPGMMQALCKAAAQSEVGAQIARAVAAWPHMGALTPDDLRRLMRHTAAGPERALSRGESVEEGDLKSLLRALAQDVTAVPATRTLAGEGVDELESRQLHAAMALHDGREVAFSMLLPFADAEPVDVRWAHSRQTSPDGQASPWVVELHTRSSRLGEIWLRTRISEGVNVELVMWAAQADLAARARAALPSLGAWLNESGLRMAGFQVIHGEPPPGLEAVGPSTGEQGRLVDLRA